MEPDVIVWKWPRLEFDVISLPMRCFCCGLNWHLKLVKKCQLMLMLCHSQPIKILGDFGKNNVLKKSNCTIGRFWHFWPKKAFNTVQLYWACGTKRALNGSKNTSENASKNGFKMTPKWLQNDSKIAQNELK